jgi:hypothetical protein
VKKFLLTLLTAGVAFITSAQAAPGYSEVNNALFDSAHLDSISEPGVLTYSYKKDSYIEDSREDIIKMTVSNIRNTGRRDLAFEFFTGAYNRPYLPQENMLGNWVFAYFLEFDVHEMNRLTSGEWRYFQRKIRWALQAGADKKEVDINYDGKTLKATQYVVQPYVNDPKNSRYKLYASKYYIFTLCDEIPGEIYQVRTIVPDGEQWSEGDSYLVDESITFAGFNK